jgi:small subunit ribosomal protein S6
MPLYELGVILDPTLEDEQRTAFLGELKELLAKEGATIVKEDVWGKRTLAYLIDHKREGYYVFWQYEAPGTVIKPLEYRLRLSDQVMRYLNLNLDREMQRARKMEKVRAAQKAAKRAAKERAEAAAAAAAPTAHATREEA